MAIDLEISHENAAGTGRYWAPLGDGFVAELTYRERDGGVIVINHTGVLKPFEGRGIALALVKRAVADAREKGLKIVPQCPYVAVQFRRHPDWADLLA